MKKNILTTLVVLLMIGTTGMAQNMNSLKNKTGQEAAKVEKETKQNGQEKAAEMKVKAEEANMKADKNLEKAESKTEKALEKAEKEFEKSEDVDINTEERIEDPRVNMKKEEILEDMEGKKVVKTKDNNSGGMGNGIVKSKEEEAKKLNEATLKGNEKVAAARNKLQMAMKNLEEKKTSGLIDEVTYTQKKEKFEAVQAKISQLEEKLKQAESLK